MSNVTRRGFLASAATISALAAVPGRAVAMDPVKRSGPTRMRVGLAAYSMRDYLQAKPGTKGAMDLPGFVDWAATLDTDAVELTSYYFPEPVTAQYLHDLKRRCHLNGLDISGGAIRNNFTMPAGPELEKWFAHVDTWLDHYATLGAPVIRVFAGIPPKGISEEEGIRNAIVNLRRACDMAAKKGVILGLENHDYLTDIDRMLPIVRAIDSPWFGVNLDSGNVHTNDPYAELAKIAPYAVNVQVKVETGPSKARQKTDIPRVIDLLAKANFRGYVVLEYKAKPESVRGHSRPLESAARGHRGAPFIAVPSRRPMSVTRIPSQRRRPSSPTRRRLLTTLPAAIAATTGAAAIAQERRTEEALRVDKTMLDVAEKLFGIDFNDAEEQMALRNVHNNLENYEALRKVDVPLDTEPAIAFRPYLPGGKPAGKATPGAKLALAAQPMQVQVGSSLEDLAFLPVTALASLIASRKVSSTDLTRMYLDRLERLGPRLLCVVTLTRDLALAQAGQADREIAAGKYRGPLHGIPWGAKDLFATRGIRTTWGAKPFENQVIDADATVVERLRDAGAVLLAKLSMGSLAMGGVWFGGFDEDAVEPRAQLERILGGVRRRHRGRSRWFRTGH